MKRESEGKGEETQIMHFPRWQELADWRKDFLALEKNTIFSKRRSQFLKRFLGVSDSKVPTEKLDLLQFYFKNSLEVRV